MKHINRSYGRMLLQIGKWGLIFLVVSMLCLGIGVKFVLPAGLKKMREDSNTTLVQNSSGSSKVLYKDKAIPKDYDGEINASGPELIYENQSQAVKHNDGSKDGVSEDDTNAGMPGVKIPVAEQKNFAQLVKRFLGQWETFSSSTTKQDYLNQLRPYLDPQIVDNPDNSVVQRKDNDQPSIVGPGKSVGSRLAASGFTPDHMMTGRRYDGKTAYLTTNGEIILTGDSLVLSGKRYIRSYAIILRRGIGGWKIMRVVAQTLKEVID